MKHVVNQQNYKLSVVNLFQNHNCVGPGGGAAAPGIGLQGRVGTGPAGGVGAGAGQAGGYGAVGTGGGLVPGYGTGAGGNLKSL